MTNPNHTDTSRSGDLVKECRLDAKAFRENTVYDSDGDPIRLIANAERLDQYADRIEALEAEVERLREALTDIGVYGCGMLNQPAALNGPEEAWLRLRIREMENVARAALGEKQ